MGVEQAPELASELLCFRRVAELLKMLISWMCVSWQAAKKKEDSKKGEEAEKKAKDAEEARHREADKGRKRWAQDTAAKLPFEMLFTGQEQSSSTCPKCGSMSTM